MAFTVLVLKRHTRRMSSVTPCKRINSPADQVLIIGDTKFDMIGAQETGIKKVCCYLGFGEEADLLSYQPDWIARTIDDIISQL